MSVTERVRLAVFSRVKDGQLSVAEAGRKLGLSERQARRIWKRYRREGDRGLIHGLRGKKSNAAQAKLREKALALYRAEYAGFNAAHASEKLWEDHQLSVPRQSLWRWLKDAGLVPKTRKVSGHRKRREPKACCGELVQMDGSEHDWFSGRGNPCVLFVMVDDATGKVFCRFYASEDTRAAFDLFGRYVKKHGLPLALYVDKDSIYRVNDPLAQEAGRQRGQLPLTQFGRAMKTLGVKIICANSPQAKGRVERMNGTLQDRLVAELSAARIGDSAAANAFLEKFLPKFNRRFMRPPSGGANLHRKVPAGVILEEVLCLQEQRTLGRDWCIRWDNQILQMASGQERLVRPGQKVQILELANGTLRVLYRGRRLVWKPWKAAVAPATPAPTPVARTCTTCKPPTKPYKPAADHPFHRPFSRRSALGAVPAPGRAPAAPPPSPPPPPPPTPGSSLRAMAQRTT